MKRYVLTALLVIMTSMLSIAADNNGLILEGWKETAGSATVALSKNWPRDNNDGRSLTALVRFAFENLSTADINEMEFKFGITTEIVKKEVSSDKGRFTVYCYVNPTNNASIEVVRKGLNYHSNILYETLKPGCIYDVTCRGDIRVPVSFSVIYDRSGAAPVVSLETGQKAENGVIKDVTLGKHYVSIRLNGAAIDKAYDIRGNEVKLPVEVEISNDANSLKYTYDIRPRRNITINSQPKGASVYIDNKSINRSTPCTVAIPYGNHEIRVKYGNDSDSKAITVSSVSATDYMLYPKRFVTFNVTSYLGNNPFEGALRVNGIEARAGVGYVVDIKNGVYTLRAPVGEKVDLSMSAAGSTKKKTVEVKENMDPNITFKFTSRRTLKNPWKSYDIMDDWNGETNWIGWDLGYLQKTWSVNVDGTNYKWGRWTDQEPLHGIQTGIFFRPSFWWGLGLYTGLYYEICFSPNNYADYSYFGEYNRYIEHDLYLPVHASYFIPFSNKIALFVHGGVGMDLGIAGKYYDAPGEYEAFTDVFDGDDWFPKRFNLSWEVGADLRIKHFNVGFTYSRGITNQNCLYYMESPGDMVSRQNKWCASIAYLF